VSSIITSQRYESSIYGVFTFRANLPKYIKASEIPASAHCVGWHRRRPGASKSLLLARKRSG